ncbi:hypothetical protein [Antrihabitans stalactiti]|uniref:Patatin-like phospholipase n=1 Tax=Antrihabitans stalactiti TaxID=2584121 RepID=A0A848KKG1_9NOCA|nr:hypothetical protein [Antrihabitans stalactiti]NMN98601.1 hypothetical protein [Antrihabitans stalactiti]
MSTPSAQRVVAPHRPDWAAVRWWFTALVVGLCAAIMMAEINRLIATVVDNGGEQACVDADLLAGRSSAWAEWRCSSFHASIGWWIALQALLGLVVVGSVVAGTRIFQQRVDAPGLTRFVAALVVCAAAHAVAYFVAAGFVGAGAAVPALVTGVVNAAAIVTAIAFLALVLAVGRDELFRDIVWSAVKRVGRALWLQRLAAIVVFGLALLALVPSQNIFDQLPDVVRSWFDPGGAGQAVAAIVVTLLVAVFLLALSRQRTEVAYRLDRLGDWGIPETTEGGPVDDRTENPWVDELQRYGWWLAAPALVLAVAVVLRVHREWGTAHSGTVLAFVAVPVAVVGASIVIRVVCNRRKYLLWRPDDHPKRYPERRGASTWIAGDLLALGLPIVSALGVVRALTAPVVLRFSAVDQPYDPPRWTAVCLVLALIVIVVLPLWGTSVIGFPGLSYDPAGTFGAIGRLLDPLFPAAKPSPWANVFPVLSITGIALSLLWPKAIAGALGEVATVVVVLGIWSMLLGFLIVHLQSRQPLEIFRLLRMRANPFLSITAVAALAVGAFATHPSLHSIEEQKADRGAVEARPDLHARFDAWLAANRQCDRRVPNSQVQVRPMLLVAASGGGIRAAEWTAGTMTVLADSGVCAANSTLLSSGVSGGSVGLALSRSVRPQEGGDPIRLSLPLGESDALATASAGLIVNDFVAGVTGLRIRPVGAPAWMDRAGLIEDVWDAQAPQLADSFDPRDIEGPAGALIFNATAGGSKCRVLISQLTLAATSGLAEDCSGNDGGPAGSIDMLAVSKNCPLPKTWATAALISARFPYVTPTARVGIGEQTDCRERDLQLVDGGYAEGSGLGTIADLAPAIAAIVLQHNQQVLAGISDGPIVVPLVAYLDDEPRVETPRTAVDKPVSEALAPPLIFGPATAQLASTTSLTQRIANEFRHSCVASPTADDGVCATATTAILGMMDETADYVVTIAPPTKPSVRVPLGWALSDYSHRTARNALQSSAACVAPKRPLCTLVELLRRSE